MNVCPGSPLPTVQAGVNAAAAGDTIQVCAGTFAEQVMVTKSVKLVGAGSAQTTIVLPRPVTGTQDVVTVDGTGGGVDVEISGFTIKGLAPTGECAPAGTTYLLSGIYVRNGANANIHDNVITGMRGDPLDGCQKGSGIRVGRAATPTSGTATITNNTISDYQKTGIIVDNAGSAATITGNTITGVGPTNVVAQNGMQISRGAVATVSGNRVSGNAYTGSGFTSTGLLLFGSLGKVAVSGNTFSANDVGISVAQVLPPPSEATAVRTNTISGGKFGISVTGPTTAVLIEENKITGASDTGIDVGVDAAGNLLRGNEASGADPNTAGEFDCHDRSVGARSSGTDNIWIDNTGAVALPDGICSPKSAPPGPPVEVEPPQVIVLPPSPPNGPVVQPPQPAGPVAEAKADEVIAKMRDKQLSSCTIELRARGQQNLVVARGFARAPAGGRGQMVIKLDVQPKGEQLLDRSFGGVLVNVHAICRTATGETVNGVKGARAVLAIERVVTTPGSWLPDLAGADPGRGELRRRARPEAGRDRRDPLRRLHGDLAGQPCRPDGALTAAGAARLRAAEEGRPLQGDRADRPAWNRESDRLERHRDGTGGEPPRRHHVRAPPRRAEEQRPRLTAFSSAAATSRSARPGSRPGTGSQVGFKGTLCD